MFPGFEQEAPQILLWCEHHTNGTSLQFYLDILFFELKRKKNSYLRVLYKTLNFFNKNG